MEAHTKRLLNGEFLMGPEHPAGLESIIVPGRGLSPAKQLVLKVVPGKQRAAHLHLKHMGG